MQKFFARLIGREVVFLLDFDGTVTKRWARRTPFGRVCRRFSNLEDTQVLLMDGGGVRGPVYVESWMPA